MRKGCIQIYTGDGKGKTTAALGLSLRAIGAGYKIFFAQFIKGMPYSEIDALKKLSSDITIKQFGLECFIKNEPTRNDKMAAQKGLKSVAQVIDSGKYDIVIMDEVIIALYYKLITVEDLLKVIKSKPEHMEIIITGRKAPQELIDIADLVTEMVEIKHYYKKGIEARKGIEY